MAYGVGQALDTARRAYGAQEAVQRQEKRAQAQDKRAEAREQRAVSRESREAARFQEEQTDRARARELLEDQQKQKEYIDAYNRGMAVFVSTAGEVVTPLEQAYNKWTPDGNQIKIIRNPETGKYQVTLTDRAGESMTLEKDRDGLGKFFMSVSDPVGFMTASMEAEEAEKERKFKIRLKSLQETKGGNLSPKEFHEMARNEYELMHGADPLTRDPEAPSFEDFFSKFHARYYGPKEAVDTGGEGGGAKRNPAELQAFAETFESPETLRKAMLADGLKAGMDEVDIMGKIVLWSRAENVMGAIQTMAAAQGIELSDEELTWLVDRYKKNLEQNYAPPPAPAEEGQPTAAVQTEEPAAGPPSSRGSGARSDGGGAVQTRAVRERQAARAGKDFKGIDKAVVEGDNPTVDEIVARMAGTRRNRS